MKRGTLSQIKPGMSSLEKMHAKCVYVHANGRLFLVSEDLPSKYTSNPVQNSIVIFYIQIFNSIPVEVKANRNGRSEEVARFGSVIILYISKLLLDIILKEPLGQNIPKI